MHTIAIPDFWAMRAGYAAREPAPRRWPPLGARSLAIFIDLGLSDAQIARYFEVAERRIASLRRYYGLT